MAHEVPELVGEGEALSSFIPDGLIEQDRPRLSTSLPNEAPFYQIKVTPINRKQIPKIAFRDGTVN